jgi:hypothetical protein
MNQAMQQLVSIADHVQALMLMLFQGLSQSAFQVCFVQMVHGSLPEVGPLKMVA